ncbi:MAG: MoaD/ThiS family protein [Candidatus Nezhaarchaeales archaeon]
MARASKVRVAVEVRPGGLRSEVEVRGARVADLLRAMGYERGEAVVVRRGKVLTEVDGLAEGDELVVYEVISGGAS